MSVINISKLTKTYTKDNNKINIIKNLSVNFDSKKVYAVRGESGAGKTTFLLCISLLCEIDDGIITINGKNIVDLSDDELSLVRNKEIGIIFQNYHLLPYLTAIENVMVPLLINNKGNIQEKKEKCKKNLKYVGLSHRENHYPSELSGGEQQRIAIARALINDPNIILADEPTGNLDKHNKIKVLDLLRKIADDGKCVIIVTHDDDTLKYVDEVYDLKEGKLVKNENKR